MAINFVPDKVVGTLSTLAGTSDEAFEILVRRLGEIPPTTSQHTDLDRIVKSISELGGGLSSELGHVLISLYGRMQSEYVDPTAFVADLVQYLEDNREDYFPKGSLDRLSEILKRLLSIESIKLGQNASGLMQEAERLFIDARIVTDIRPVFTDDAAANPTAAVLVHTLKIDYSSGDSPNGQYYFALDDSDLESLFDHIQRALTKSRTLKALLLQSNIRQIT